MYEEMLQILIDHAKTNEAKEFLKVAKSLYENSGYYNWNDWEEMTEEEKIKEVLGEKPSEDVKIWNVGISGSEMDDVLIERVEGTEEEVKKYLYKKINADIRDAEEYSDVDYISAESPDEVSFDDSIGGFHEFINYDDHHDDYVARIDDGKVIRLTELDLEVEKTISDVLGKDYENIILEDGPGPHGGISYDGETLEEFMDDTELNGYSPMKDLVSVLKECSVRLPDEINETIKTEHPEFTIDKSMEKMENYEFTDGAINSTLPEEEFLNVMRSNDASTLFYIGKDGDCYIKEEYKDCAHDPSFRALYVLENGYADIEAELCAITGHDGTIKPVIDYFCCIKRGETEDAWESDFPYCFAPGESVDVDFARDDWKEQLAADMFTKLGKHCEANNYDYKKPIMPIQDMEYMMPTEAVINEEVIPPEERAAFECMPDANKTIKKGIEK